MGGGTLQFKGDKNQNHCIPRDWWVEERYNLRVTETTFATLASLRWWRRNITN